jgi:ATP-dependent Lon protease
MLFDREKNEKAMDMSMEIPLLPLRDVVVFPHMIVPLFVGRERSIAALESAMKEEKGIFMAAQKSAQKDDPAEDDIYSIGTIGIIIQLLRLPDGTVKVLVEGKKRGIIREYLNSEDFFLVRAEELDEHNQATDKVRIQALMRSIRESFETYAKMTKKVHLEMVGAIASIEDASKLADRRFREN